MPDAATCTPAAAAPTVVAAPPPAAACPTEPAIRWYRSPVPRDEMRALLARSDLLGALQAGGYLATLLATGGATIWASRLGPWWAVPPLLFLHGMVANFLINAVHELGHETVFTSRRLNRFAAALFAFPAWINHRHFAASHARHHRYTLHPPADLEVTLPSTARWRDLWRTGFVNPGWAAWVVRETWATARGRLGGEWNAILFRDDPEARRRVVAWARFLVVGHGAIVAASLATGWWVVPLVVSFPNLFGAWLHWLCNGTQHIGLQDNVPDARLCCRTFLLAPVPRFLYWQMNYHIEHHMFAAVPCYRLGRLHRLMRDDLPPCPVGLRATWREVMAIVRRQAEDPTHRHVAPLPPPRAAAPAA